MSSQRCEKLYILGHPVGHSKSPDMYNAVYPSMGLNWEYGFADEATEADAKAFLDSRNFLSINITTPYKTLALGSAETADAPARLANGANVLVNHDGLLHAYNVDGEGCVRYLKREGVEFSGSNVVVCGTGPTAMSILCAAVAAECDEVVLAGRDHDRTQRAVARYFEVLSELGLPEPKSNVIGGSYSELGCQLENADIILDATSLGMNPNDPAPFDTSLLHSGQVVFDTVYGHGETALMAAARNAGCRSFDGRGMLVAQAVATVHIVCGSQNLSVTISDDELFDMLARGAGFSF